jgi:hypothetical protein
MPTNQPAPQQVAIYIFLFIWTLIWKGLALWRAARYQQRNWFIAILIIDFFGIIDILYLFQFAKHKMTFEEISNFFRNLFTKKSSK